MAGLGRSQLLGTASIAAFLVGASFLGVPHTHGVGVTGMTMNAANYSVQMIGHIVTEDGASHTLDNTGQSAIFLNTTSVTFANVGTTLKIGLAPIDTSATTTPPRASNTSNVVNFDVAKTYTGGGGGVANSGVWHSFASGSVSGSKTVANGDLVCVVVQMTARAGSDAVSLQYLGTDTIQFGTPTITTWMGSAYATVTQCPLFMIRFSDGTYGWFEGAGPATLTASTGNFFSNSSNPDEWGNYFKLRVPTLVSGFYFTNTPANAGNFDLRIYEDPFGSTPVQVASRSCHGSLGGGTGSISAIPLATPVLLKANTPYAVVYKATSTGSVTVSGVTVVDINMNRLLGGCIESYAVLRNNETGAFATWNSNLNRLCIGILAGGFGDGSRPGYGKAI